MVKDIKKTLAALAASALKDADILSKLEDLTGELREGLKAERLTAARTWTEKVPTFEGAYRTQNQKQIIGKADNIRFSKGIPAPDVMAALNAAAKDATCVLVLQTKQGFRKVKASDLEESHIRYADLLPDMSEADKTAFENAKSRYNLLVTGSVLVPEEQKEITFLD